MDHCKRRPMLIAFLAVAMGLDWGIRSALGEEAPPLSAPPDSFFEIVRERDREAAREFYKKHLNTIGIPVVASAEVADEALRRTHEIVSRMLAGRPDIVAAMVRDGMYLIVIGKDQVYTDMPEYRNSRDPEYMNERVRGTGGKPTSFGEENLLGYPLDRYDDESIAVHEFCHTIDGALRSMDGSWRERRDAVYHSALEKGLYKNAYAAGNPGEYWAEICQSYFDTNRVNNWNHGPIGTREQLKAFDPEGYELVRTTFALSSEQDWRYRPLRRLPDVSAPPAKLGVNPHYGKFTWARELTVLGREASDEALLRANHTVRRLFAYRHDVLKALIADGVKLVVLGRDEKLASLPELSGRDPKSFDALARYLDYAPDTKLLVASEESILASAAGPLRGQNQVIRVLAGALYHVTAKRPVDPDWENRGRRVQQYELRVKRLDVRFDEALEERYRAAMEKGSWKGTAAVHDRIAYWVVGVLAYFDAVGQDAAPGNAPHPIATREALAAYDPGLHGLVAETMAYEGRVDWRHGRD